MNGRRGLAFSMNHYNLSGTIKIPNDEIAQGSLTHVIDFLDQSPRAWYACVMIKNQRQSLCKETGKWGLNGDDYFSNLCVENSSVLAISFSNICICSSLLLKPSVGADSKFPVARGVRFMQVWLYCSRTLIRLF